MTHRAPLRPTDAAIIGIACRFPGGVNDPDAFWRFVSEGRAGIGDIPADRMDVERLFEPRPATPGRMMTRKGGFLDNIDRFDAEFFGISPREAERMDPQQRLLLELAYEVFEDGGQDLRVLDGSSTGVFVGQWLSDFETRLLAGGDDIDFYMTTGSGRYAASGRLSYSFGLRGPSMTLDTACSSSLVAVHLAARSIRTGESALAIAGGVNVILQPHINIAYSQSRMMAADGRCKFGDASGDGYVRSEGAGLVLLKPLDAALRDGDRIYAVIRGGATNNDGRSSGSMGTPSLTGQIELLRAAHADAAISPTSLGYVEAHGTGTRVGDPVELGALGEVIGLDRPDEMVAYVGSVKTNFGHTEGAAGVAGLIKATLATYRGLIPPSLHLQELNPAVSWDRAPVRIPVTQTPWPNIAGPRLAAVSAFGIAGSNAHIVVEQAPATSEPVETAPSTGPYILPLSAKHPEALRTLAAAYAETISTVAAPLEAICWNAAVRRTPHEHRAAFVALERAEMERALRSYASGAPATAEGIAEVANSPRIVFVFPGQGGQWSGMGRRLIADDAEFRAAIERCDAAARPYLDWSILEQLQLPPDAPAARMNLIDAVQPILTAIFIAYARSLQSRGVTPSAVVGHSMGEVAAAHIAGVLDLDAAMQVVCRRSALMREVAGLGAMALIDRPMAEMEDQLASRDGGVSVAVSNSPRSCVISGDPGAIDAMMREAEGRGVFCRRINVDVASHSPQMEPLARRLRDDLVALRPRRAAIPIYSTVLGGLAEGEAFDADYWARNLRRPVRFSETTEALLNDGVTAFVEVGPNPVLLPAVQQTANHIGAPVLTVSTGARDEDERIKLTAAVAQVWVAGGAVDWRAAASPQPELRLPAYPWRRERHWAEAAELVSASGARAARLTLDAEQRDWLVRLQWRSVDRTPVRQMATVPQSWTVIGEDAHAFALCQALRESGASARQTTLSQIHVLEPETDGPQGVVVLAAENADAPFLPLLVLQAVKGWAARSGLTLWFVTKGAQSTDGAETVGPEQAALWGAARVLAEEHPELWGGLVDVSPETSDGLARELLAPGRDNQLCLRPSGRYALKLERAAVDGARGQAWRADGAYLITGGFGDLGLHIAREMAEGGARRLILAGRTALPPRALWALEDPEGQVGRRIAAVRALERAGVAIHLERFDVADEASVAAFLRRYETEGWPPIRGVIHTAGVLRNALAQTMDRPTFDAACDPKFRGAQILDRLFPKLDLFVLFSSTGAILAQPGQANYAAANAALDAVALNRRLRGQPAISLGWGVWEQSGLVRGEAGEANVRELARQGVGALSPVRAARTFAVLCGASAPQILVAPIDWPAYAASRRGRNLSLFTDLTGEEPIQSGAPTGLGAGASPSERRSAIEKIVKRAVADGLKLPMERLDVKKPLGAMGLNSLMAMEIRNRLETALSRPLSATLVWNLPTIEALVNYLAEADAPVDASPAHDRPSARQPSSLASAINASPEMSDADAIAALRT